MSVVQKAARNEAVAVQAKTKALKEQQRSRLDSRHYYMLDIVSERLQLESSVVEDYILDGDQVFINQFVLELIYFVVSCLVGFI